MRWVVAYDVRQDRMRRRIALRLERFGFRRQKSVFEGELSAQAMSVLLDELATLIEPAHDVLTAWPYSQGNTGGVLHRGAPRAETSRDWIIL